MRAAIFFFFVFMLSTVVVAQQGSEWAGPDTSSCGELGVMIGIASDPCPTCCYQWTPATGLSCTDCLNPIAKPETKTTYTISVISENLEWKEKDEVVVDLTFGEILFTPDHLVQGTTELVTGKLLNNQNDDPVTWAFKDDINLGCTIQPQPNDEAKILPGDQYGEVIIKAINGNVPGCESKDTLPINNGVKDVLAIDPDTPDRIAKAGQTLYVFDQDAVLIKAIPNQGGFKEGIPDWKADSHGSAVPIDGEDEQTMYKTPSVIGAESDYIAGDDPDFEPQVKVIRRTSVSIEQNITPGINALINLIKAKLKFKGAEDEPNDPCGPLQPFSFDEGDFNYKMKFTEVEKYKSPLHATKKEATIDAAFGVTGKIYHPQFTRSVYIPVFNIAVCSRLYASAGSTIAVAFNLSADPSQMDDGWKADNIQGKFGIKLASGFVLTVESPLYLASGSAEFSISVESVAEFQIATRKLVSTVELKPATCTISTSVYKVSDVGQVKKIFDGPSAEIQLMAGYKSNPITLYDFN